MEMLLALYKSDKTTFKQIIKEKIRRDTENLNLGRDIQSLLGEKEVFDNTYLEQRKFSKFDYASILNQDETLLKL